MSEPNDENEMARGILVEYLKHVKRHFATSKEPLQIVRYYEDPAALGGGITLNAQLSDGFVTALTVSEEQRFSKRIP